MEEELYKEFWIRGFPIGRMISHSKSGYYDRFPTHDVIFNANIIIDGTPKKIWHGDLDFTVDEPLLKEIATVLKTDLYILREFDARFGSENDALDILKNKAVHIIKK